MKISQAVAKIEKAENDIIIMRAGTNNLSSATPQQLSTEIINALTQIHENNRNSNVIFSPVFKRQGRGLKLKIIQLNKILDEELALNGYDVFNNDNILLTNLVKDGLPPYEDGVREHARNLSKFMRYC